MFLRKMICLVVVFISSCALAGSKNKCSEVFAAATTEMDVPRKRYVDVGKAEMREDLRRRIRMVRGRVAENLGWLPRIRDESIDGMSSIKFYLPGKKIDPKNRMASRVYSIDDDHLVLDYANTNKKYRNKGLSLLLLAEILARNPEVESIEVENLQESNYLNFEENLKRGGREYAVKQTCAYKALAAMGFTEVTELVAIPEKTLKRTFPEGTFAIGIQQETTGFTVRRADR